MTQSREARAGHVPCVPWPIRSSLSDLALAGPRLGSALRADLDRTCVLSTWAGLHRGDTRRCTSDGKRPPPDLLLAQPWLLCAGWRRPPVRPPEGGLPQREEGAARAARAPREEAGSGGLTAASAARATREVAPGEEIATRPDPQYPLDATSKLDDIASPLVAGRATAKGRARLNTPLQPKTRVWDFDLPIEGGDRKLRW